VDTVTLDLIKLYGHMYLDLGRVENVALLRLLNTHNREFNDRGTKTLRIDVLPASLSNPRRGVDMKQYLDTMTRWTLAGRVTLNPTFQVDHRGPWLPLVALGCPWWPLVAPGRSC
jgi:hypothetical protein